MAKKKTTHKVVQTAAPVLPPPTIIEFLLDETGSMTRFLNQTLGGFQEFVDDQRKQSGSCLFTLTKFDTLGLRNPYADLDINVVPYLTPETYTPSSGTNLNDAIVARIEARRSMLTSWDIQPRVLFVAMTDGEDNASKFSTDETRSKIMQATQDGWTFVYLGAYQGSDLAAKRLGFLDSNIRCFDGSKIYETMQELSAATKAYRASVHTKTDFYAS